MGTSKTEKFSEGHNRVAAFAKALAHPARIAIVEHLIKSNSCVCGQIVDQIPLSQSTISQHLKELKQAGIIDGEVEGTSVCYKINEANWRELTQLFNQLFSHYLTKVYCC